MIFEDFLLCLISFSFSFSFFFFLFSFFFFILQRSKNLFLSNLIIKKYFYIKKIGVLNVQRYKIYGKGLQKRSFCYIEDMIDGLIRMMNSEEKGPINIGNPYCEFTLIDLVKVFESIVKKPIDIHYLSETENDPQQRKPNIEKAQKLLGFEPKTNLEEGLKKTIDYFISIKSI